jgi:hypothetical protein
MRKAVLGAASALVLASPAMASDLAVTRYSEVPGHAREIHTREVHTRQVDTYEHRTAPRVVVKERAPVVSERVVVRRPPPVIVERQPVVVERQPVVVERPPVIVERPEVVVERPPVVIERPRVVVEEDEYPVYAEPRLYASGGPVWRAGWGHRRHFRGGW